MKAPLKILIVIAVGVLVAAAIALKERPAAGPPAAIPGSPTATATATAINSSSPVIASTAKLPRLVDLGAKKCIPCKMMAPILADLQENFSSHFVTEFIDVWENPAAGREYGVEMIPTQIFYDAEGRERYRHVGFLGKEDILAQWKALGVETQP
jgi:thioredoxin 1